MSDAHDLHVLHDLIAAVRATEGAPAEAAEILQRHATSLGGGEGEGHGVLAAAREALGGLMGGGRGPEPAGLHDGGAAQRLAGLMARFEGAMADDRLSGPSRDAVILAFDPVKSARDRALQLQGD